MPYDRICVFWDNSNIYIPAQQIATHHEKWSDTKALRIHFQNLLDLTRVGRRIEYGIAVGSVPPDLKAVWKRLESTGIRVELFERGAESGKEQGVDQCLQVHMLRVLADYPPGVAVLMTGDGKGYDDGAGFHADLERMYRKGWGIEVISWDIACKAGLRTWAQSVGAYVKLEDYYESVTFMEGIRPAIPLGKHNRTVAKPHVTP